MPMTKLTLNADRELIEDAKRVAAQQGTSLSSMFSRFMRAVVQESRGIAARGVVTNRVLGLVSLPKHLDDRGLVEDALADRFGK